MTFPDEHDWHDPTDRALFWQGFASGFLCAACLAAAAVGVVLTFT